MASDKNLQSCLIAHGARGTLFHFPAFLFHQNSFDYPIALLLQQSIRPTALSKMSEGSPSHSVHTTPISNGSSPPKQLRVLTLNVWGLAFFSKLRNVRIPAIAARLASSDYDIVALQEIWCESTDWRQLRDRCHIKFPYSKFFFTGAFGSGLAILSKFPIVSTHTHPYSLNGHPVMVHHGDWIVAKAAGCATIEIEGLGLVDFWVTHTVAAGGEDGPESKRAHRVIQAYELAKYARNSAAKGHHVVCLGDFNSTPPSLSIAVLRDVGQLNDAFLQTHPSLPPHAISLPRSNRLRPDPRLSISELGVTCDSPLNTWTAGKKLDERALKGAGKRLDYIMFRGPDARHKSTSQLRCTECNVNFTELIEGQQCSYSDHFGLEANFEILSVDESELNQKPPLSPNTARANSFRLSQTLTSSLSALSASLAASRQTQRNHTFAFIASVILAFTCILFAGIKTMGRSGLGAIWAFFVLLFTWLGTTSLYSALIWGEWEKRTLKTFSEAMELDLLAERRKHSSFADIPQASTSTLSSRANTKTSGKSNDESVQRLVNVD